MRTGGFPARDAALRLRLAEIEREGARRASRRLFLGLILGGSAGVAAGLTGGGAWREPTPTAPSTLATPNPDVTPENLSRALRWASGPVAELVHRAPLFLSVVELVPQNDPRLWLGVGKLVQAATEKRTENPDRLRRRLLHLERLRHPPAFMAPWFAMLRRG